MREPKRKDIDGVEYEILPLGAKEGKRVFMRLIRALGPAFAMASTDGANVATAIAAAVQSVSVDDLDYFCDVFAPLTSVRKGDKQPQLDKIFDDHFQANYGAMMKWLMFCFEVNFGDFFASAMGNRGASQGQPKA